jgi:tRNA pseudouridine38-40 synthase
MSKKYFKCVLSYRGTAYHGWQVQNKFVSIQGLIEYSLKKVFGFEVKTTGAGRTDAGVHAFGQVFAFSVDTHYGPDNIKQILNALLPHDIRIISAAETFHGFNPRWNVKDKLYRYVICNSKVFYPVYLEQCWHVPHKLDMEKMNEAAMLFRGEHDFYCFSKAGAQVKDHIRKVDSIKITKRGKWITLDFRGKSFLHHMIRRLTGAMIDYSRGYYSRDQLEEMMTKQDRSLVNNTAPADGLYLVKVTYDKPKSAE